jgi:hypothetical protein
MKKFITISFIFTLLLLSCATKSYVWDEDIAPEGSAVLVLAGVTKIDSFNGVSMNNWVVPNSITIPAGSAKIGVSASYTAQTGYKETTTYSGQDMIFSYDFEAGKTYYLIFRFENKKWGMAIFSSHWARKDQKLGFAEFTNIQQNYR